MEDPQECETSIGNEHQSIIYSELEALKSIYISELEVCANDLKSFDVAVDLHPATAEDVEKQYVRMMLVFSLTDKYPDVVPNIEVKNPRGLSDEKLNSIKKEIVALAESKRGNAMLFEIIGAAKELLTAQNTPCGVCGICLYGFNNEDVYTKTDCYHYFHSHCLARYCEHHSLKEMAESANTKSSVTSKEPTTGFPCPVCRVPIMFEGTVNDFPPISTEDSEISLSDEIIEMQKEMALLYEKQLQNGGIIDIEAEKNKFLLEISNVPTLVNTLESQIQGSSQSNTPSIRNNDSSSSNNSPKISRNSHRNKRASPIKNRISHQGYENNRSGGKINYDENNVRKKDYYDRNYDEKKNSVQNYDKKSHDSNNKSRYYNDRGNHDGGKNHDDRRNHYEDRRNQYEDRRNQYDDRRNQYNDRHNYYIDRRNQYDYGRNGYDDRKNNYDDKRNNYEGRRNNYEGRGNNYDDRRNFNDRKNHDWKYNNRSNQDDRKYEDRKNRPDRSGTDDRDRTNDTNDVDFYEAKIRRDSGNSKKDFEFKDAIITDVPHEKDVFFFSMDLVASREIKKDRNTYTHNQPNRYNGRYPYQTSNSYRKEPHYRNSNRYRTYSDTKLDRFREHEENEKTQDKRGEESSTVSDLPTESIDETKGDSGIHKKYRNRAWPNRNKNTSACKKRESSPTTSKDEGANTPDIIKDIHTSNVDEDASILTENKDLASTKDSKHASNKKKWQKNSSSKFKPKTAQNSRRQLSEYDLSQENTVDTSDVQKDNDSLRSAVPSKENADNFSTENERYRQDPKPRHDPDDGKRNPVRSHKSQFVDLFPDRGGKKLNAKKQDNTKHLNKKSNNSVSQCSDEVLKDEYEEVNDRSKKADSSKAYAKTSRQNKNKYTGKSSASESQFQKDSNLSKNELGIELEDSGIEIKDNSAISRRDSDTSQRSVNFSNNDTESSLHRGSNAKFPKERRNLSNNKHTCQSNPNVEYESTNRYSKNQSDLKKQRESYNRKHNVNLDCEDRVREKEDREPNEQCQTQSKNRRNNDGDGYKNKRDTTGEIGYRNGNNSHRRKDYNSESSGRHVSQRDNANYNSNNSETARSQGSYRNDRNYNNNNATDRNRRRNDSFGDRNSKYSRFGNNRNENRNANLGNKGHKYQNSDGSESKDHRNGHQKMRSKSNGNESLVLEVNDDHDQPLFDDCDRDDFPTSHEKHPKIESTDSSPVEDGDHNGQLKPVEIVPFTLQNTCESSIYYDISMLTKQVAPPPGFNNRKVVYGPPARNPPPGFQ